MRVAVFQVIVGEDPDDPDDPMTALNPADPASA
jgi:hypothetical protein